MKYVLFLSAILLVFATSCKKSNNGSAIDSNIKISMQESLDTDGTGSELGLSFLTTTIYSCSNYNIINNVTQNGNHISIIFTGIYKPDFCLTSLGPASAGVNLGKLSNGIYSLTITNGNRVNNGSLIVSDSSYIMSFPSLNNISITSNRLVKVPAYTMWGTVGYDTLSQNPVINSFLDSLVYYGAQPFTGPAGNYCFFNVDPTHSISDPHPGYYVSKNFIYNYQGNIANLKTLVNNYGLRYPDDSLTISLFTYKGDAFHSNIH